MNKIIHALHHQSEELLTYIEDFRDDTHSQGVDGEHQFQFTMDADAPDSVHFDELTRILVPLEDDGFEEFVIYETETNMRNEKIVYAIASYTDMDRDILLNPGRYHGTLREMVAYALPSTEWRVNAVESIAIRTIHLDELEGGYSFLMKVAKAFDLEMHFRMTTSGNRISGKYVDFVEKVGDDTKKEIVYGKDLIGIEKKVFSDRIVTALKGVGPENADGERLTSYVENEEAFQRWNRRGKHRLGKYAPESSIQDMTQAQLDQYTKTELDKRIASVVEYYITADSIEIMFPHERVRLGDRVRVKNPEFSPPLYADARIIRVERSISNPAAKVFTIGEVKTYTEEEVMATFRQLQRLYGLKVLKKATPPTGATNTIWIDTSRPIDTPHTYNMETQTWEKFSPTNAAEIGGVVVGKQYNGVAITPEEGLVVDRTDQRVKTVVNATDGISIQSRKTAAGTYEKVFYANEEGRLTLKGIDIVREDGFKVVNNGIIAFDFNIQGVEPPFLAHNMDIVKRGLGQWYVTESAGSADVNQYSFKHQGRYLKIFYRVLSSPGNTAHFEVWRGGQVVASAYSAQTDEYSEGNLAGYTLTIDLGVPTGLPSTFQIRLRSSVAGLKSYGQIMRKWLEG